MKGKAAGPFRCVHEGWRNRDDTSLRANRLGEICYRDWKMDNLWQAERGCPTSQSLGRMEVEQVVGRKGGWISQRHRLSHIAIAICNSWCVHVPSHPSCWLSWSQFVVALWDFGFILFLEESCR